MKFIEAIACDGLSSALLMMVEYMQMGKRKRKDLDQRDCSSGLSAGGVSDGKW